MDGNKTSERQRDYEREPKASNPNSLGLKPTGRSPRHLGTRLCPKGTAADELLPCNPHGEGDEHPQERRLALESVGERAGEKLACLMQTVEQQRRKQGCVQKNVEALGHSLGKGSVSGAGWLIVA